VVAELEVKIDLCDLQQSGFADPTDVVFIRLMGQVHRALHLVQVAFCSGGTRHGRQGRVSWFG